MVDSGLFLVTGGIWGRRGSGIHVDGALLFPRDGRVGHQHAYNRSPLSRRQAGSMDRVALF